MISICPQLYSLSIENIKQKISNLINLGYSQKEVIQVTLKFPQLYGYSKEKIEQKIKFYDEIGLHNLLIVDPYKFIHSVSLVYARYRFLEEKRIIITMNNCLRLFRGQKEFYRQHKITTPELLERYDYNKYLEERTKESAILSRNKH